MEMEIPVPHFSDSDSDFEIPKMTISKDSIPKISCDELANMIQNPEFLFLMSDSIMNLKKVI